MPRKNRRAPLESLPSPNPRPRSAPPAWAEVTGYEVRHLVGDKGYRCPGCDHVVRPGAWHLVVIPEGAADDRHLVALHPGVIGARRIPEMLMGIDDETHVA